MHFPVLVVTKEYPTKDVLDDVMRPFQEWDGGQASEYEEFCDETDYELDFFKKYVGGDNDDFIEYLKEEHDVPVRRPGATVEATPQLYPKGYILHDKQAGTARLYSVFNPHSKWDYFLVGGAFAGRFKGRTRGRDPNPPDFLQKKDLCPNLFKVEEDLAKHNWELVRGRWGERPIEYKSLDELPEAEYRAQPFISHLESLVPPYDSWSITDPVPYTLPFEEGVEIMVLEQTRFARCIVKDGVFYDPDDLFPSEEFPRSTFDKYAWGRKYKEIFDTIEDDEWLTIVDIHR